MALPYIISNVNKVVSKPGGGAYVACKFSYSNRNVPGGSINPSNSGLFEVDSSGSYVRHYNGIGTSDGNDVAFIPNGFVYFGMSNIYSTRDIVRLNQSLTTSGVATLNAVVEQPVTAVAVADNGDVYFAGNFTTVDGVTRRGLARVLAGDGTIDPTYPAITSGAVPTFDITLDNAGRLLAGGTFTDWDGTATPQRIVRLLPDGTLDTTFNPSLPDAGSLGNRVYWIAVDTQDRIYVGRRGGLSRLLPDGSLDTTFSSITTWVRDGVLLVDGTVMVVSEGVRIISNTGDILTTLSSPTSPRTIGHLGGGYYLHGGVNGNLGIVGPYAIPASEIQPPNQVTSLTLIDIAATEFTVEWAPPADNGSPITDYVIEYRLIGAPTYSVYADGIDPEPTAVVGELEPATEYEFRIAAVNDAGTGPFSLPVSVTTTVDIPAPLPGQGLKARLAQIAGTPGAETVTAANAWAGTVGETLTTALNRKAGTVGESIKTALNTLAGTSGEDAVSAARKIGGYP